MAGSPERLSGNEISENALLAIVLDCLSVLENPSDPTMAHELLGKLAVGFGFEAAAAFVTPGERGADDRPRLAVAVGPVGRGWDGLSLPELLWRRLASAPDRAFVLPPVGVGAMSVDDVLPPLRGRGFRGVAVPLVCDGQADGAVLLCGPRSAIETVQSEMALVRIVRAFARALVKTPRRPMDSLSPLLRLVPPAPAGTPSEGPMQAVFDDFCEAVVLAGLDRRVAKMNREAERLTGWTQAEAMGISLEVVVRLNDDPDPRPPLPPDVAMYRRLLLTARDGTRRPVACNVAPVRDGSGALHGLVAVFRDDSTERRIEAFLHRSRTELRRVVDRLPFGVVLMQQGRVALSNRTFADSVGWPAPEALVGAVFVDWLHPEDRAIAETWRASEERTAGPLPPGEYRFQHSSGRVVCLEVFQAQVVAFEGAPTVLIALRDVTDQRIQQAGMLAQERLGAVGTLAAGVAHEINNPLTFVVSNLDQLGEQLTLQERVPFPPSAAEMKRVVGEARHGVQRIRTIIRELAVFARTAGETPLGVDLSELVGGCLHLMAHRFRGRARVARDLRPVRRTVGDASRIGQVVLDLLERAAQSLPDGREDKHSVHVAVMSYGLLEVAVEIRDDGPSIPADMLARVFEPFALSRPAGIGNGLGLCLAERVVRAHGGRIDVESSPKKGNCFRVVLPVMPSAVDGSDDHTTEPHRPPEGRRVLRILVIDDESLVGRALSRLLRGHEVRVVGSGPEALEVCRQHDFDAIFCDVMMPAMNGPDVLKRLAVLRPGLENKVCFMTGGTPSTEVAATLLQLPNPLIEKPFEVEQVRNVLLKLIDGKR